MSQDIELQQVYEANPPEGAEAKILQVKDLTNNVVININWASADVDTAFCNYIIRMACSTRGIEK